MSQSEAVLYVFMALVILGLGYLVAANTQTGNDRPTIQVQMKPKHPTHKTVCECTCKMEVDGKEVTETQTFEDRPDGCGKLDKLNCKMKDGNPGSLEFCAQTTVPTSLELPESLKDAELAPQ